MEAVRLVSVNVLHNLYYAVLWWRLTVILDTSSEFSKKGTIAAGVLLCITFTAVQILIGIFSIMRRYKHFLYNLDFDLDCMLFVRNYIYLK